MLVQAALSALNHLLDRAPWARSRLAPFAGRVLRIEGGPVAPLTAQVAADGYLAEAARDGAPDLVLSLPADTLARLASGGSESVVKGVRIEGDAELADAFGFVMRNLHWDVEEDLSRVVGDIAAHRLVETARAVEAQGRRLSSAVAGNLGEYLTEESRLLVTAAHHQDLAGDVALLRDSLARLEKRVERLERR